MTAAAKAAADGDEYDSPILAPLTSRRAGGPTRMVAACLAFKGNDSLVGRRFACCASGKHSCSALPQALSCSARAVMHGVQILSLSSARDLSSLACTCRVLRDLIFEDEGFSEPLW